MILGRFENGGVEGFNDWAREIHGDVIEGMPTKVETKLMDISTTEDIDMDWKKGLESTRLAEKSPVIAFRATVLENGRSGNANRMFEDPGLFILQYRELERLTYF